MDVQQIIALALVSVAAASLVVRAWRQARGQGGSGCGGCAGACGKPVATSYTASPAPSGLRAAPQAKPLITLGPPPPRRSRPEA